MGTIAYLSIALGSLLLGFLLDKIGRKPCLLLSGAVTPIIQMILVMAPTLTLVHIYLSLVSVGLFFALRVSSAYIWATESLPADQRMLYGVYLYASEGLSTVLTPCSSGQTSSTGESTL